MVAERKAQITDLYNAAPDKSILTSAWLKAEMKKIVSPEEKTLDDGGKFFINGAVEYIPRKTKDVRPVVVRVPLLKDALEILDRYQGSARRCDPASDFPAEV